MASVTLKTVAPALVGEGDAGGADRRPENLAHRGLGQPGPARTLEALRLLGLDAIGGGQVAELFAGVDPARQRIGLGGQIALRRRSLAAT